MHARAKEGACWGALVRMALPLFKAAEHQCPRTGPGRPPVFPDWAMAALIMVAILAKRKTKSSQYRYLSSHRDDLLDWLGLPEFPSRTTYFDRYRRAHRIMGVAVRLQGQCALDERVADARTVAVDKSLISARGPVRHRWEHRSARQKRGVDSDAAWGYSEHDGWVYGYSYEVVVTATRYSGVLPLLASVDPANRHEARSFGEKIEHLPPSVRYVVADKAYDKNEYGQAIEYDAQDRRTGRRFICPPIRRHMHGPEGGSRRSHSRQLAYGRRYRRIAFYRSPKGYRLHKLRSRKIEPFNAWFKSLFELDQHVSHRRLDNNRTHILASIFVYQLLLRWNHQRGNKNGQIKWIIDTL